MVAQDSTFTTSSDTDVNIKCPKENLRKRQYTMHLVFNAGKGADSYGWCDLVCKGKGKKILLQRKSIGKMM